MSTAELKLLAEARRRKQQKEKKYKDLESSIYETVATLMAPKVETQLIPGERGAVGERGEKGERGEQGPMGPRGLPGKDGRDGVDGKTEVVYAYQELPDDLVKEDSLEELREEVKRLKRNTQRLSLGSHTSQGVKYHRIETAEYKISRNELLDNGITIFGVYYVGNVTITIPEPTPGQIIYINDESGNADSNNITVTTLQS